MTDSKINLARSLYYAMFSKFFVFTSDHSKYYELIEIIDILKESPLNSESQEAFSAIRTDVISASNVALIEEYDELFHSPESQTVIPSASSYDDGIDSTRKRVEMQGFLAKTTIRRDEKMFSDYEDHVGFIFAVMSELVASNTLDEGEHHQTAKSIFEQILNAFLDDLAKDLYEHEKASIYKNVAVLLKSFITFERSYLDLPVPVAKPRMEAQSVEVISDEEQARRERNRALRAQGPKKSEESCDLFVASNAEEEI